MSKPAEPPSWHICRDCLDPIAAGLQDIAIRLHQRTNLEKRNALMGEWRSLSDKSGYDDSRLNAAQKKQLAKIKAELEKYPEPPQPDDIKWLYERHHLSFALTYLKITASVDFARDMERQLEKSRRKFARLALRANQILAADNTYVRCAVHWLLERHHKLCGELPEEQREGLSNGCIEGLPDDMRTVQREIVEPFSGLDMEIINTVKFLRQAGAVLRAKLDKRDTSQEEVQSLDDDLARLRMAITAKGRDAKPEIIRREAELAEDKCRDLLRKLEEQGEYSGFARARPKRYR